MKKYTYIEAIGEGFPTVFVGQTNCLSTVCTLDEEYASLVYAGGDPIPSKAVLDAWITADIIIDMWTVIQQERDRRKFGGVLVNGNWFHSDDTSRIQQLGLVIMGVNLPTGIMWKTMAGTFVEMTPTLASQIFQATAAKDVLVFDAAEKHHIAMTTSPEPEKYDMFNGSPPWPAIYGE